MEHRLHDYYAAQNERLSLALNSNSAFDPAFASKKINYKKVAENGDEASKRQLTALIHNGRQSCEEFLKQHHSAMDRNLELVFGKDPKHSNVLRDIYEKIEEDSSSAFEVNELKNIFNRSRHFLNVRFQDTCPRCSGIAARFASDVTTKQLGVYERSKFSRKSYLSFNTQHKGNIVQVVVTIPCPECCATSLPQDLEVQTTPYLEESYIEKEKLLEEPKYFVEECIWQWINDYK